MVMIINYVVRDEVSKMSTSAPIDSIRHIYTIRLRTVHWTGWGVRTVQVLLSWSGFVRDWPPPARLCYRAFSAQNQWSIGCDMSRDEATHYTIGVSLPQNPFSLINFVFHVLLYSTAWVINQP